MKESTELVLSIVDDRQWIVKKDWKFFHEGLPFTVMKGFIFDFATIPRFLWVLFPPATGNYKKAALVHDWMYVHAYRNKRFADLTFLQIMKQHGVSRVKRTIMFLAVVLFGRGNYGK